MPSPRAPGTRSRIEPLTPVASRAIAALALAVLTLAVPARAQTPPAAEIPEGDYVLPSYRFRSGQTLADVRLHYHTIGTPRRDARGKIRDAVLVMHGSSGDTSQVLATSMRDPLVGAGLPLDPARYFLILPDILGAGKSTRPSDGLRATFPRYGYDDLVDVEYRLITEHFGIERLRLVMGISMGGMLGQSPGRLGERLTTYAQADAYVREVVDETLEEDDANNILSSRTRVRPTRTTQDGGV